MKRQTTTQENHHPSPIADSQGLMFYRLLRESSKAQRDRYGLPMQRQVTEQFAASLDGTVTEGNTSVVIESAGAWVRSDWQKAVAEGLRRYQSGQVNAFLLPRVDRETRNLFASIPTLKEVIDAGIPIYFAEEEICLTPNDPEAIRKYLEAAMEASAYLRRLVKNTKPGRIARARDGQKHPTNTAMFGFDLTDGKRVPNEAEAVAIREAAKIALREGRPGAAAHWLNHKGFRTTFGRKFVAGSVRHLFRNTALIGETRINFKEGTVTVHHEPILDRATFEALRVMLNERRLRSARSSVLYALRGIAFCGCGRRFGGNKMGERRYYRCEGRCGEPSWRKERLEREVNAAFGHYLQHRENRRQYLELARQSRATLEQRLWQIERGIAENDADWRTLLRKELADYPPIIIDEEKRRLVAERESLLQGKAKLVRDLDALPEVDLEQVQQELKALGESWQMANKGGFQLPCAMSWERVSNELSDEQAQSLRRMLLKLNCRVTIHNRDVFISGKLQLVGAKVDASRTILPL